MADSDLNIKLKVTDEASAGLKKVGDEAQKTADKIDKGNEGLVKGVRKQIQPLNLLLRTIARVGFIWGATLGLMSKAVLDLGKDIDKLDVLSVHLGVSASDLSRRFYGFDITTKEARAGVEGLQNLFFSFEKSLLRVKLGISDVIAENAIFQKQHNISPVLTGIFPPLALLNLTPPKMSRDDAIKQIQAENMARRQASAEGQAILLADDDLWKKLTLTKVEYTKTQFAEQMALFRLYGIDTKIQQQTFDKEMQDERDRELWQQGANQLKAQGDITGALLIEQNIQLQNYRKIWGKDGAVVATFKEAQKILMDKTIMQQWINSLGAVGSALGSLESALAGAEEMGKAFATAAAAVALGMAIVNTAEGITKAWSVFGWNPPLAASISGIIAAAGAIQIATIAAQKFHEGGLIRAHNGLAVDEVPIIAQTGEGIISRRGMEALGTEGFNRINAGGGGAISVYMENVSFRSEDDIEDVMTRLSNLIILKTRSKI